MRTSKSQMAKFQFYLIYYFLSILALFPLRILYFFSDFWFLMIYYVFGYRKNVVTENLKFAFPEKDSKEIKTITRKFYIHLCDYLFESIKILHISKAEINQRFTFKNFEIFDELYIENKSAVLVSAHQGNWEWMIDAESKIKHKFLAIYKPLANKSFDKVLRNIRTKYAIGGELVAMDDIYKLLVSQKHQKQKTVTWFLVDQSPPKSYPFWIDFLNRETPFYAGPAKIARKFDQALVFMEINKLKRGYYEAEFSMLVSNPKDFTEEEIIEKYVRRIEAGIKRQPEYWLWSHRRWKHKKEML